nr:retrotransposon protein, putative, unclassified [Tanacetum cinerariifolium]
MIYDLTYIRLQVKQKKDGIFISQDKYVAKILRKFGLTNGKSASTPIDTEKPLLKDPDGEDMDVHTYSDYAGASLDKKSTTGSCQFLGYRFISWQCKKQTVVATSSTEAEYVAATIDEKDGIKGFDVDLKITIARIFAELARIGYEKPFTKLTFYKAFFLAQWFLIHKILQCMSAKRTAWNEFSFSMAPAVICPTTEQGKIPQAIEIIKLNKGPGDTVMDDEEDAFKQGEIAELDADEDVSFEEVDVEVLKDTDVSAPRRRSGMIIQEPEEAATTSLAFARELEAELSSNINWNEVIEQVKRKERKENTVMIYQALKRKPVTESHARKNMMVSAPRRRSGMIIQEPEEAATTSLKQDEAFARELEAELSSNINWNEVIEQVKRKERKENTVMIYQALKRKPVTESHARKNMMKGEKEIEEEDGKRKSENLVGNYMI